MIGDRQGALDCATGLVRELLAAGVQGFVVSPGSRSTPLAIAIARCSSPAWVILDERSAAFFALGRASALNAPVALVCTSGTAAANYLPAVVEASERRVPLVVITADRPPELHGVGANQTIMQSGLYAPFVRAEFDLDAASPDDLPRWRTAGGQAARVACLRPKGPVHVNAPFREPFIPTSDMRSDLIVGTTIHETRAVTPSAEDAAALSELVQRSEKILVFAGGSDEPIDRERIATSCERIGAALVVEPTSGLRSVGRSTYPLSLEIVAERLRPDLVIQLGRAPTQRSASAFLASVPLVTVDVDGWKHDPSRAAMRVMTSSPEPLLESLPEKVADSWVAKWFEIDAVVRHTQMDRFEASLELWEGSVAHEVARAIPQDGVLVVGSSMPIRDLDSFGGRFAAQVVANRGASGIDGLVSTFAGAASLGRPTVGMIGDLSALHDLSGLVWLQREHSGLLVVVDNDGGAIFDHLGSAALEEHEHWFKTPHQGRLGPVLDALGDVHRPRSAPKLREALTDIPTSGPMKIVHVEISSHASSIEREEMRRACNTAVSSLLERI